MLRLKDLTLPLDHDEAALAQAIAARLGVGPDGLLGYNVFRRAHDARRKGGIRLTYTLDAEVADPAAVLARDPTLRATPDTTYRFVGRAPPGLAMRPVVIGAGPCGLFAGLVLAQMGFRPIILERGRVVRERTRDTWGFWRRSVLDPTSNVQFGEGGAGTFSDGKLYSQISDRRHYGRKVLEEFVRAGAPAEILYVAKPHIGTFRLVTMVEHLRATIEALGGEYRFGSQVEDIDVRETSAGAREMRGLVLADGEYLAAEHVVLAIGHSARDTFAMLHRDGRETVLRRRAHRASAIADRPRALRDASGAPRAGSRGL